MPRTIHEILQARQDAKSKVDDNQKAAADLDAKIKADNDALTKTTVRFASALKTVGDFFEVNADGTATAYFASTTTADGFYSEVLRPAETAVPDDEFAADGTDPNAPAEPAPPADGEPTPPDSPLVHEG